MTRMIIRAVRDRAEFITYLRAKLPWAEFCFDRKRDAMDTFLLALDMAGTDPVIHAEDDIVVCDDFKVRCEAVIAANPDTVIQFFSMRKADLTQGTRMDKNFMMGQCFYLPAGYSTQLLSYYPKWPAKEKHPTGLDVMVADWLKSRRQEHLIHVPSLVDHRVCRSVIDHRRSSKRQSFTFKGRANDL